MNLLFKNIAWPNIGDAPGLQPSAVPGSFFISLHSADPGEAGDQTTSEIAYTGYSRVAVGRGAGFTVSGDTVSNAAVAQFGECTAGTAAVTHFSVGTDATGAGTEVYMKQDGVTPRLTVGFDAAGNRTSVEVDPS